MFEKVANLMVWVLENDSNGVVKHEACYQIAARDMRDKIPALLNTALYDERIVARHEAIEALGLMRATEVRDDISGALDDKNYDVRETAQFVLKRLDRVSGKEKYQPSEIL